MGAEILLIVAFCEGANAFDDGMPLASNFYKTGTREYSEWARGWRLQSDEFEALNGEGASK